MPRIDAHHHLWKYSAEEYPWIQAGMDALRRDFLVPDLVRVAAEAGIDATVAVQARQTLEETEWLLELASRHALIGGVVGWVPLTEPSAGADLERFARHPKLKGVRHVLHDEPDDSYMLRDDFNRGVSTLRDFGLVYDILIFERHLPQTIRFVDRHPQQVFILDHIAKPRIREGLLEPWRRLMFELARRPNVYCKLSGVATEAAWSRWTPEQLRPYIDMALEAFGPRRLMFGSDWPVVLLTGPYRRWAAVAEAALGSLSAAERERVMGGTALEVYRLVLPA
ncbi:MAG: amidohydrolase family protein [Bryobacteraceae bacterium]|nr:amidohydrolase family protein [Bryobacteraceae bacterium]